MSNGDIRSRAYDDIDINEAADNIDIIIGRCSKCGRVTTAVTVGDAELEADWVHLSESEVVYFKPHACLPRTPPRPGPGTLVI